MVPAGYCLQIFAILPAFMRHEKMFCEETTAPPKPLAPAPNLRACPRRRGARYPTLSLQSGSRATTRAAAPNFRSAPAGIRPTGHIASKNRHGKHKSRYAAAAGSLGKVQAALMRSWSVATITLCAAVFNACSAARTTIGLPPMSANAFSGSLLDDSRAGIIT